MAWTSWTQFRSDLKDALDRFASGAPEVEAWGVNGKRMQYRSVEQIYNALEMSYKLEALENKGTPQECVSYGRYSRY